ncbi:MAG: AgmX/PglI C-terminal domain-containing protein [Myxococcales bacterium]|nr:AgmX/PglI C-terminal domain-containing protein [Myxococcales bacterium]
MGLRYEIWRADELLVAEVLAGAEPLTVGPRRAQVPTDELAETVSLLSATAAGYRLELVEPLCGEIVTSGRRLRVRDGLLFDPRPEPLLLREGDSGQLSLDDDGLELRFFITAQRARLRRFGAVDWSLLTTVAAVAVAVITGAALVSDVRAPAPARARLAGVKLVRVAPPIFKRSRPKPPRRRRHAARDAKARTRARHGATKRRRNKRSTRRRARLARAARGPAAAAARRRTRRTPPRRIADVTAALTAAARHSGKHERASLTRSHSAAVALVASAAAPLRVSQPTHVSAVMPRLPSETHLALALSAAAKPRRHSKALSLAPAATGARPAREAIERAVRRGSGRIRHCFERELLVSGDSIQGRLLVRWRIDASGRAQSLSVVRDSVRRPRIRACILRVVRGLRFPACGGAGCRVTFPFELYVRS